MSITVSGWGMYNSQMYTIRLHTSARLYTHAQGNICVPWKCTRVWHVQYSSKATWYLHACCSLKIVRWRLHHAFNIWMGPCYIRAHIRQIVGHLYPPTLHSFLNKLFNETLISNVYTWWTYEYCLCMFQSILESNILLKNCSHAVACSISFLVVWCGEWILYWRFNLH